MKAKLIKVNGYYYLQELSRKGIGGSMCERTLADTNGKGEYGKLSKQNCDEIFGVVDINSEVEAIVKTICPDDRGKDVIYGTGMAVGIQCFNKAMELNKDRVFTRDDIEEAFAYGQLNQLHNQKYFSGSKAYLQSLLHPTEIEVEIELICPHPLDTYKCGMQYGCDGDGCNHPNQIPYLDIEKCLILTKKI